MGVWSCHNRITPRMTHGPLRGVLDLLNATCKHEATPTSPKEAAMQSPSMTTITAECVMCEHVESLNVPTEDLRSFRSGTYAQVAFPTLSPADREFYLLSGLCPDCWAAEFDFEV